MLALDRWMAGGMGDGGGRALRRGSLEKAAIRSASRDPEAWPRGSARRCPTPSMTGDTPVPVDSQRAPREFCDTREAIFASEG